VQAKMFYKTVNFLKEKLLLSCNTSVLLRLAHLTRFVQGEYA